jgi:antitoxin component of MazEF toxin-antitoxin module
MAMKTPDGRQPPSAKPVLSEGAEVEIHVGGDRAAAVRPEDRRQALARLRRSRQPFPTGFRFDRERAHER